MKHSLLGAVAILIIPAALQAATVDDLKAQIADRQNQIAEIEKEIVAYEKEEIKRTL